MHQATPDMLAARATPGLRSISVQDVRQALSRGIDDFRAMPTHYLFFALFYAALGLVLARAASQYDLTPMIFPLVGGFALLGPIFGLGLSELSRRREQGQSTTWWRMFSIVRSPALPSILGLGIILMLLFTLWLRAAYVVFEATFPTPPASTGQFLNELFTTGHGWALIILGNGVGLLFALVAFAISVIAFPLMLDRHAGLWQAIGTSISAVLANPVPMLAWGLIVGAGLFVGSIPLFLGLAIVLPILGHGTWHLYRTVVER